MPQLCLRVGSRDTDELLTLTGSLTGYPEPVILVNGWFGPLPISTRASSFSQHVPFLAFGSGVPLHPACVAFVLALEPCGLFG